MRAALSVSYGALLTITAVGAAAAGLAGVWLVDAGAPHDVLPATAATAVELLTQNLSVALWPLALAGLRWHEIPLARTIGDGLVAGQIAVHGLLVGGALGQQAELWRYLPHLPVEWLALALPVAAWIVARRGGLADRAVAQLTLATVAALFVAASLETWAVPL